MAPCQARPRCPESGRSSSTQGARTVRCGSVGTLSPGSWCSASGTVACARVPSGFPPPRSPRSSRRWPRAFRHPSREAAATRARHRCRPPRPTTGRPRRRSKRPRGTPRPRAPSPRPPGGRRNLPSRRPASTRHPPSVSGRRPGRVVGCRAPAASPARHPPRFDVTRLVPASAGHHRDVGPSLSKGVVDGYVYSPRSWCTALFPLPRRCQCRPQNRRRRAEPRRVRDGDAESPAPSSS